MTDQRDLLTHRKQPQLLNCFEASRLRSFLPLVGESYVMTRQVVPSHFVIHLYTSSDVSSSPVSSIDPLDFAPPAEPGVDRRKIASTRSMCTTNSRLSCSSSTGIAS